MQPKLILASASPQRKKLLKHLGLRFVIAPSRAQEVHKITTNCADLVMLNARRKAEEVARRNKEGVIIGADSLVYLGNHQIMGKPKNLQQAKTNLKKLFAKPSWVYTGVAVIDAATQKKIVDYEKTKVFMKHFTDEQIDRYHALVSPLDKAGGFDIEGKGSIFIHRIEGCYFNVIGLPLSKLSSMLKQFGVSVLMMFMMIGGSGCASEFNLATQQQETLIYGTDKEVSIGNALARQFDKNYEINTDVDINERVEKILDRIVAVCDRKELVYSIKVINDDVLNAVSLPGGYIYINKGLIDAVKTDDQLASVIGHEVGHITAKHAIKKLQAMYGYTLLQLGAIGGARSGQLAQGLEAAFLTLFTEFSQDDELLADKLGIKYAKKAGYDPQGMTEMLAILKAKQDKEPARPYSYWRTHPYIPQRIASANQAISGQIEFRDYLNLTGENNGL